jgi:hypothetical protein
VKQGEKIMTLIEAKETKLNLEGALIFTKIDLQEIGYNSNDWRINAWIKNNHTGNDNLTQFTSTLTAKEAKKAAKEAKKEATEKDARTRANRRTDRQNQY